MPWGFPRGGRHLLLASASVGVFLLAPLVAAQAATDEQIQVAERWLPRFQPSTLSRSEQLSELEWFIDAAEPFRGMKIEVVSERIATHAYESKVLARAFSELTGIEVTHTLKPEGDVIETLQRERRTGQQLYDAYISDSDLIGTHFRYGDVVALSDYMRGEGADVTLPTLDIDDFMGRSFVTGPDGKLYQLPDQQFANLYWFRYDWFQRPDLRRRFKELYGYELGVPVNWSAYEDIAQFFTEHVKRIDGERVYGHMDYGKKDPSLGWRFTDAWLSMAGAGDVGLPNGQPVDEWGIRVWGCRPVGANVARGGATNSPAAVYALSKYLEWLDRYAPPEASNMNFTEAGPVPARGHIAQQIFWYTAFTADMNKPGLPVVNADGTPKWRMAPSPHGAYWEDGMKLGYQDTGSWTLFRHTDAKRRKAAWLYAQFTVAKTVSLKKTLEGLTPIRRSDIESEAMTEVAPRLGGLVEFYRSPDRENWTPTGINVPDYPKLASLWWRHIGRAVSGEASPREALDQLAAAQNDVMDELSRSDDFSFCKPSLYPERGRQYWLDQPGSPKPKLADEKPQGQTIPYDELVRSWRQAH